MQVLEEQVNVQVLLHGPGTKGTDSSALGLAAAGGGDGRTYAPVHQLQLEGVEAREVHLTKLEGTRGNTPDTSPVDGSPQKKIMEALVPDLFKFTDGQFNPGGGGGAGSVGGNGGSITTGGGNKQASTDTGSGSPFTKVVAVAAAHVKMAEAAAWTQEAEASGRRSFEMDRLAQPNTQGWRREAGPQPQL